MKANEVRKMSAAELESKLVDLKKDLFNLRLQHATNQLDNPIKIAEVKRDIASDIKGRHVLILEDIYDTGNSLDFTYRHLLAREPASLKICTLLDKPERRRPGITLKPDYVGFTIPNAFVVGYGLDYNEHYRNLPYVGVLKPEAYGISE